MSVLVETFLPQANREGVWFAQYRVSLDVTCEDLRISVTGACKRLRCLCEYMEFSHITMLRSLPQQ
jgi:hypothetical protein